MYSQGTAAFTKYTQSVSVLTHCGLVTPYGYMACTVMSWDDRRERSFHKLLRMMNDRSILTPFKVERKTHLVTDASPQGISASLYQENEQGRWLPVDHISRALSQHEQAWKSQIEWESLAKIWGMTGFRLYLIGTKFTSWGDHQPLLPFYNDLTKPATARINKHRARITDLTFTDKYLSGKVIPVDFNSRHLQSISHLNRQERQEMAVDDGEDIYIMRVIMNDLPLALTTDMIQQAALTDPVYQKLISVAGTKDRWPWPQTLHVYMGWAGCPTRTCLSRGTYSHSWRIPSGKWGQHQGMGCRARTLWTPGNQCHQSPS